jgi:hypothetical protein
MGDPKAAFEYQNYAVDNYYAKEDEYQGFDESEFYPFVNIDPNEVHSHSVGTYIDLDHKSSVKSEPALFPEEWESEELFDEES